MSRSSFFLLPHLPSRAGFVSLKTKSPRNMHRGTSPICISERPHGRHRRKHRHRHRRGRAPAVVQLLLAPSHPYHALLHLLPQLRLSFMCLRFPVRPTALRFPVRPTAWQRRQLEAAGQTQLLQARERPELQHTKRRDNFFQIVPEISWPPRAFPEISWPPRRRRRQVCPALAARGLASASITI